MSSPQIRIEELENFDKIWHLRQATLVDGLSDEELSTVSSICKDRFYVKNSVIFERGEPAAYLYILFRGCIRSSVGSINGRERIVALSKTGDVFGENIIAQHAVHRSQATAHEDSWVGTMSRKDFVRLLTQRPSLALNFIRILSQKLGEAREDIESLSFLGTQQRLAKTLLKLGQTHGTSIITQKSFRKLRFALSHEHLARLIGANRPHVSTIMSSFKKKGWINYQGRKLLINMEELTNISGSPVS